jgi:hypothetical protein
VGGRTGGGGRAESRLLENREVNPPECPTPPSQIGFGWKSTVCGLTRPPRHEPPPERGRPGNTAESKRFQGGNPESLGLVTCFVNILGSHRTSLSFLHGGVSREPWRRRTGGIRGSPVQRGSPLIDGASESRSRRLPDTQTSWPDSNIRTLQDFAVASGRSGPGQVLVWSPVDRLEVGASDMPEVAGGLRSDIVGDVCCVPHHNVMVTDRLAILETVQTGLVGRPDSDRPIVDL